jgi:hypothetical protein
MKPILCIVALMILSPLAVGCAREVSRTESSKPNILDDGRTTKRETTVKNADGSMTTETKKTRTND